MNETKLSDDYPSLQLFFSRSLEALKKWKSIRKGAEIVGLVIAIGVYLLKPTFWIFLAAALFVMLGWAFVAYLEHSTFAKIEKRFAGLFESGAFETFQDVEQKELSRLFDLAGREISKAKGI